MSFNGEILFKQIAFVYVYWIYIIYKCVFLILNVNKSNYLNVMQKEENNENLPKSASMYETESGGKLIKKNIYTGF